MTLHINDTTTLGALQESFSALFPYLRLEVKAAHGSKAHGAAMNSRITSTTLAEFSRSLRHAELDIDSALSVHEFEHLFLDTFGVQVEVFRRSGRVWLKTMMTDDWSLEFQNEQGRVLSE